MKSQTLLWLAALIALPHSVSLAQVLPLGKAPELPRASHWDGPFLDAISVDKLQMTQSLKSMYELANTQPSDASA